ncbi:MAG: hypothetical protein KGM24_08700 [Elusimicrobia bacterium]|nr:hypothetical protein [Elusimicrobiota bacterium]
MGKRRAPALTRADLEELLGGMETRLEARLGARFDGEFAKIDDRFTQIDDRFAKMDDRLDKMDDRFAKMDEKLDDLSGHVRRLDLGFSGLAGSMDDLGRDLRRDMGGLKADVTARLESFGGRMETLWRDCVVYPKMLDEQAATLRGREARLSALEGRKTP